MPPCHLWNAARAVCQVKSHKVALIKSVDFTTTLLTPRLQSGDWRPSTWRLRVCAFSVRTTHAMSGYRSQLGILKMSMTHIHLPCSKGWPFTAVAFILRASRADVSQCEPLLVSWSLSAWSLSPWPLSRRLARSASLNVELQQSGRSGGGKKHNLTLTPHDYSYLIATVIWLDTGTGGAACTGQKAFG